MTLAKQQQLPQEQQHVSGCIASLTALAQVCRAFLQPSLVPGGRVAAGREQQQQQMRQLLTGARGAGPPPWGTCLSAREPARCSSPGLLRAPHAGFEFTS